MNDLMIFGLAGMIASWIAIQLVPGGRHMKLDAFLALLCLLSLAAALVGGGMVVAGVMR
jgi:hypothetical protein